MFKTAATKIAHNSTIPSLGGNKDLKPLQDVITAEKSVLISLQKLSVDFGRAAEALRVWGSGEGEDLLDTLSASTNLLNQFSTSISNYASHEHAIRDHMKAIRSREEALDELKRRRKAVISKADAAEKKLSKMSPEHKNLGMQTDTLNRLRDEIRSMDSEIMSEEASLGDFKRSKTKAWMGLKFGGLLEFCEKGTIIGEFGRLVIGEISEETTQPGMSRTMYMNHQKVSSLVTDATRCVEEVAFSTLPAPGAGGPPAPRTPTDFLAQPHGTNTGHFLNPSEMTSNNIPPSPMSPSYTAVSYRGYPEASASRSTDDFSPSSPIGGGGDGGGRFATFPVSTGASGFSLRDGPPPVVEPNFRDGSGVADDSFSSSVAAALNFDTLGSGTVNPTIGTRQSIEEPAPSYETHQGHLPDLPSGAADPLVMPSPWEELYPSGAESNTAGQGPGLRANNNLNPEGRVVSTYGDDVGLAYMTNPGDDEHHEYHEVGESEPDGNFGHMRQSSKEVHFGQVQDIDTEMEKRHESSGSGYGAGTATGNLDSPTTGVGASSRTSTKRVPPPSFMANSEDEERALNAAAAREVSRELDQLNFNPPPVATSAAPPRVEEPSREWRRTSHESGVSISNSNPDRTPSPLIPPVAPFAQRGISPIDTSNTIGPNDYSNNDKPTSPTNTSTSPPRMTLPERTTSSISNGSSYRTPPEYPRSTGTSPIGQRSTSSLTGSGASMGIPSSPAISGAGARTISAAAFRRPVAAPGRSISNDSGPGSGFVGVGSGMGGRSGSLTNPAHSSPLADVSPLQPKKRGGLPNAPSPYGHQAPLLESEQHPRYSLSDNNNRVSQAGSDDYDYLSAYTYSDPPPGAGTGSPQRTDYGSLGQIRVTNASEGEMGSGTPPSYSYAAYPEGQGQGQHGNGGYGEGRFTTDLDGGSGLR